MCQHLLVETYYCDLISTNLCTFLLLCYLSTIFRSRASLFSYENEKNNLHFIGGYLDSQSKGNISFGVHRKPMPIYHMNTTDKDNYYLNLFSLKFGGR